MTFRVSETYDTTDREYMTMDKMNRILVVSVNWLGDAILMTPALKALKQQLPSSYIGIMCVKRVRGVFDDNPYIDKVITFDEKTFHKGVWSKISFIKSLKKKKFDTVFFVHRSFTKAFVCFLAGIKNRIGYTRVKNAFIVNKRITPPDTSIKRQDYYLNVFEKMGVVIEDRYPEFFISNEKIEKISIQLKPILDRYKYIVGINPSANWKLKRWPQDYFAQLCDLLIKNLNCGIVFIGAGNDKSIVEGVLKQMKEKSFNFCGKTDLKDLGALIKHMDLFVSNDSGPAHLSASLGIKTLAIFGPTSDKITSPIGKRVTIYRKSVDCVIPCYKLECLDNVCMKQISVNDIYSRVECLLKNEK